MKILQLPPYYYPEKIASTHLTEDLEHHLLENGFDLHIIAPTPTRGVSNEERNIYKHLKNETLFSGRLTIRRFAMFREGKSPVLRALRYLLVNCIQYFKGIRAQGVDLIFGASTPPTQGVLCALVKKRLKVPFVYNLHDIFPDSMVGAGLTREGSLLWRVGRKIENYTYKSADRIIVIGEDFRKNLIDKGVPEENIEVIYNWVDDEAIKPVLRADNALFDELSLPRNQFYVTYAGNFGESQGINVILEAAELLQDESDISFILFGGGPLYEEYRNQVAKLKLSNLFLFPLQPQSKVSQVYSLGDVSIVSCKKGSGKGALPSKTWSIMAAGTPVLASFDTGTELEKILEENNCGIMAEAGDAALLAEKVLWFCNHKEECVKMGQQARACAVNKFSKSQCVGRYVDVINESMHSQKAGH